jgi:hypothetical protein
MRKATFAVAVLLVLASAASAADTIKLGGMLPLSGRASDLEIGCKQGAELAVKEVNAKGGVLGKKFELLLAAPPWKMSGTPARWKSGCRPPGSDNRDVYLGILGMKEEEYRRLAMAGTF